MPKYMDLFVMPVPRKNLRAYKKMAEASKRAWLRAGALEYAEMLGDDVPKGKVTSFPMSVKLKAGEIVTIGYATYKSRAHRDRVMKKVHEDPALMSAWDDMPFDGMRMIWAGFKGFVGGK